MPRWALDHPALDGLRDLDQLLERRRNADAAHAVLTALAVLAPADDLAARTLLHALLPGLVGLAGTAACDDPAAIDEMVSLAWERIRTAGTWDDEDFCKTSGPDTESFTGDLLAVGLQNCFLEGEPPGLTGIDLWDVSDPSSPSRL
ncbi:MAG: hypothetical protein ACRDGH_17505, partial [Candidatus Limnocylindria bacterium]